MLGTELEISIPTFVFQYLREVDTDTILPIVVVWLRTAYPVFYLM